MTEKDEEGFISLRSRTNSSVYKIPFLSNCISSPDSEEARRFAHDPHIVSISAKDFDNVKLVFIELPTYIQFNVGINSKDIPTQNN